MPKAHIIAVNSIIFVRVAIKLEIIFIKFKCQPES